MACLFLFFLTYSLFSVRLKGDSKWIERNHRRVVTVCFAPQREGCYEATVELILCDHNRKTDFVIKRTLFGWARQRTNGQGHHGRESTRMPGIPPLYGRGDAEIFVNEEEELLDSDGTGISVSHEDGLDFCVVGRKRRNGPFETPSSSLTINLAQGFPAVVFVTARTRKSDGSDPECVVGVLTLRLFINRRSRFVARFEGDSRGIRPGTGITVGVTFSPKFEGVFKATLELVFYDGRRSAWFAVHRRLQGIAGSLEDHEHLASFGKEDNDVPVDNNREVPPQRTLLLFPPDQRRKSGFPDYEVPRMVQEAVDKSSTLRPYDKNAQNLILALKPNKLDMETYREYFKGLLNVEDGHQQFVP